MSGVTSTRGSRVQPSTQYAQAHAALTTFQREYGVSLQLTPNQMKTLQEILAQPNGGMRGTAYLGLAAAGVGLVPKDTPESRYRTAEILDAAVQVWAGENLGGQVSGKSPLERLGAMARIIQRAGTAGPIMDQGVASVRTRSLGSAQLHAADVFHDQSPDLGRLTGASVASTRLAADRSAGLLADVGTATAGREYGAPPDRIIKGSAAAQRLGYYDRIPGTTEPWTPSAIAYRLHDWMGSEWDGTKNEKEILDLTHGLSVADRVKIAEAYYGGNRTGMAALYALYDELVGELDDNPLGTTKDAFILKEQFAPGNESGVLSAAAAIKLDLMGLGENGQAIVRQLKNRSLAQIRELDAEMRAKYGMSLEDVAAECSTLPALLGSTLTQRTIEFLIEAPRVGGVVPDSYIRAFELEEATRTGGVRDIKTLMTRGATDEVTLFARLQDMTRAEFLELAAAWQHLNRVMWKHEVEGDDGTSGEVRATALYHHLYDELNDLVGGNTLWLERLALAAEGLQFSEAAVRAELAGKLGRQPTLAEANAAVTGAEVAHRNRVARYLAISFRLAGSKETSEEDVLNLLSMVQAEPKKPGNRIRNGAPTMYEVKQVYDGQYPGQNIVSDIEWVADEEVEQITRTILRGDSMRGPKVAALRISLALDRGLLGAVMRDKSHVVREVLDRPDLPAADRQQFIREVDAEIRRLKGTSLVNYLKDKDLDEPVTLPNGIRVPSIEMTLAKGGVLTPGVELVHAIHGKLPMERIGQILGGLTPLGRVAAMTEYAQATGRHLDLARNENPLVYDLTNFDRLDKLNGLDQYQSRRMRQLAVAAQVMPFDVQQLALEATLVLTEQPGELGKWVKKNIADKWTSANLSPDGLRLLRQQVKSADDAAKLAANAAIRPEKLNELVAQIVGDSRGNALEQWLVGWSSYDHGVLNALRDYGAAARDLAINVAKHGRPTTEQLQRVQRCYNEALACAGERTTAGQAAGNAVHTAIQMGGILAGVAAGVGLGSMVAIGGAAGIGSRYAMGERNARALAREGIRDGAAAGLTWMSAQPLPDGLEEFLVARSEAVQVALRGGIAGGQVSAGMGFVDWGMAGMEGGVEGLLERVGYGAAYGAPIGALGASLYYWANRGSQSTRSDNGSASTEPSDPAPVTQPDQTGPGADPPIPQPGPVHPGPGTHPPISQPPPIHGGPGTQPPMGTPGTAPPVITQPPVTSTPVTAPPVITQPPVTSTSATASPLVSPVPFMSRAAVASAQAVTPAASTVPVQVTPDMLVSLSAAYEQAAAALGTGTSLGAAGAATQLDLQGLVGAQAEGRLLYNEQRQILPTAAEWRTLLSQADRAGYAVPSLSPATPEQGIALLDNLRQQHAQMLAQARGQLLPAEAEAAQATASQSAEQATPQAAKAAAEPAARSQPVAEARSVDAKHMAPGVEARPNRVGSDTRVSDHRWRHQNLTIVSDPRYLGLPFDDANLAEDSDKEHQLGDIVEAVQVPLQALGLYTGRVDRKGKVHGKTGPAVLAFKKSLAGVAVPAEQLPGLMRHAAANRARYERAAGNQEQMAAFVAAFQRGLPDKDAREPVEDPKWVKKHLRGALELLAGREPGSLAKAGSSEIENAAAELGDSRMSIRNRVRETQLALTGFGLAEPDAGFSGIVDEATLAAFNNAMVLLAPMLAGTDDRAMVVDRLGDAQLLLETLASEMGEPLPTCNTAEEIAALTGPNGALTGLIKGYQEKLVSSGFLEQLPSGAELGRMTQKTLDAHQAHMEGKRKPAEGLQQGEQLVSDASAEIDGLIELGAVNQTTVTNLMANLYALQESGDVPEARTAYDRAVERVASQVIGQDIKKAARFAEFAAPFEMERILDDILTKGVVAGLSKERRAALGRLMVERDVRLSAIPVETLDMLDSSFAVSTSKRLGARAERVRFSDREVRDTLMAATVSKKNIQRVLEDDPDFLFSNVLSTRNRGTAEGRAALDKLASLDPTGNQKTVEEIATTLAYRYNGQRVAITSLLQDLADRNGSLASAIIVEMCKADLILWEHRDRFARDLAKPRVENEDEYDGALRNLTDGARAAMVEHLLRGSLIRYIDDEEEALAAHLKTLGI